MSEIDLNQYVRIFIRWLWLIALATGLAAGASFYATRMMPRIYLSSTTLLVGDDTVNAQVTLDDVSVSQRAASVYAAMARRQPVLEAAAKALHLNDDWRALRDRAVVIRPDGSQLIEIRVTDTDPKRAAATADQIARQLILQSPTAADERQSEERQRFNQQQLDILQANIQEAEATLAQKQVALQRETSARGVLDLQDEIQALETKLASWRNTYASLLTPTKGKSPNAITVIEPAYIPSDPISPNVRANVLMAAAIGFLLAIGAVLIIEYFLNRDRLTNADELPRVLGLPSLGSIAHLGRLKAPAEGLVTVWRPHSTAAEAYRLLRTGIRFACREEPSILLLVTSPGPGEGKTTTIANLGASFAQAGKRTILVDADLRHPSLHSFFTVPNERGLSTLLDQFSEDPPAGEPGDSPDSPATAEGRLRAALQTTRIPGLSILPAGPSTGANPGELLASRSMGRLIDALERAADVVIFDSPPALPVTDAAILASMGLFVILVVEAGQTRGNAARLANDLLLRVQARLLGVVLNKAPKPSLPYSYYEWPDTRGAPGAATSAPGAAPWPERRAESSRRSTVDWRSLAGSERAPTTIINNARGNRNARL